MELGRNDMMINWKNSYWYTYCTRTGINTTYLFLSSCLLLSISKKSRVIYDKISPIMKIYYYFSDTFAVD